MVASTTVTLLVLAGIVALIAPLVYLTYLSYREGNHSPYVSHPDPDPERAD